MMEIQTNKSGSSTDKHDRRRGRPAGKNRTPLSLEERRARNAQYERERRNETADAMAHLAKAARCDPQIANAELLATVISQLQRRAKRKLPQDIDDIKRVNQNLEAQIAALQSRLGQDVDVDSLSGDSNNSDPEDFNATTEFNLKIEKSDIRMESKCLTRRFKDGQESEIGTTDRITRSSKIRKTTKTSSVRENISNSDSDTQPDTESSNSDWSESVKTHSIPYSLRKRNNKVSKQSECSTSTYPYRTESESSQCGTLRSLKPHSDDFNQSDDSEHPVNGSDENETALSAIPEQNEEFMQLFDDETEAALLESLTDGGNRMINEWLNKSDGGGKPLDVPEHHNQVLQFLDFDNILLDISNL